MTNFKLIAGTNIGLRQNNEDNFTVCANLSKSDWGIPVNYQEEIELGERGCILVVADGMGGQNAGEVASSIAIETVQEMFAADVLPENVTGSNEDIVNYLKKTICEADSRIKKVTHDDPSTSGMGSTIVIAWILNNLVHIAWLGDSRAYCVIKGKGIARLTKDHSYVQSLVDAGKITDEQAMTHPDSNIINRSLGDTSQKAKPDVTTIELTEGEVILLCSDGLCGVCQDAVIGGIVEDHISDLKTCREELISAALAAGGSDNITIAMIHITQCDNVSDNPKIVSAKVNKKIKWNYIIYSILAGIIAVLIGLLVYKTKPVISYSLEIQPDSITLDKGDSKTLKAVYYTLVDGERDETKTQDVTKECNWVTTSRHIVSVSNDGVIVANGYDSTSKIIATYGDCKDTIVIKVNPRKQDIDNNVDSERIEPYSIKELLESSNTNGLNPEENSIGSQITPSAPEDLVTPSIETSETLTEISDSTSVTIDSANVQSNNN